MMSALISLLVSLFMLLIFIVKLSFFVVVIGLQYGVPAYIIYKLVRSLQDLLDILPCKLSVHKLKR